MDVQDEQDDRAKPWSVGGSPPYDPDREPCDACGVCIDEVSVRVSADLQRADVVLSIGCMGGGAEYDLTLPEALVWLDRWADLAWVKVVADHLGVLAAAAAEPAPPT